jgi:sugar phosphate isomerase/epimerase
MRVSVQLYTLRDQLAADLRGTLKAVRNLGIEYVELAGFYDQTASTWAAYLQEAGVASLESGLKASGAHIGLDQLEGDLDKVIQDVKTIDFKYVIVPYIGADAYADGWANFGRRLRPIGEKLAAEGLTLLYHNHDFEFANGDGLAELYGSVPDEFLKAEIDAAWVSIGGQDPVQYVTDLKGRVPLVHVKDYNPANTPRWTPCGQGVMPMPELLTASEAAGAEFVVIELDESPGDPLEAVAASYEYLKSQGLS